MLKHNGAFYKDSLTGFHVGCKTLESVTPRKFIMFLSYQYFLLHFTSHRIQTVCYLPSSFCGVLRPIEVAENIVIKELLDNAFSVARCMANTE